MNPIALAPMTEPPDDGLDPHDRANVLWGFVMRCAVMSAAYQTDYFVDDGTAVLVGGPNWRLRAEQAARAGYWSRSEHEGRPGWLLVADSEHLFHIRRKAEIEWERRRKQDVNNTRLVLPVRVRDGDGCRYCGVIVQWDAGRANRAGTYDHRPPGQPARSADDMVVSCFACNRIRGNDPDADDYRPLLPVPAEPFYGRETVEFAKKRGVALTPSTTAGPTARPRTQRDTATPEPAPRDPAASGIPHASPMRPVTQADNATQAAAVGATKQPNTRARARPEAAAPPAPPPHTGPPPVAAELPQNCRNLPEGPYPPVRGAGTGRDGTGSALTPTTQKRGRRGRRRGPAPTADP